MGVLFRFPTDRPTGDRAAASNSTNGSAARALSTEPPISPFAPAANRHRALTAAATQVKMKDPAAVTAMRDRMASTAGWQNDAYAAYENVGEINYAFNLIANLLSRIRIYVGAITDLARPPTPISEVPDLTPGLAVAAQAALDRIVRGSDYGLPGMLYDLAVNLSVTGECYLVQIPEVPDIITPALSVPESWSIRSIDEVVVTQDNVVSLRTDRSIAATSLNGLQKLPTDAYVGRIFRSSARFSGEPASSMKAVLPQVDELYLLNQMFRGTILSRLNSGLLYIPDGLTASHTAAPAPPTAPVPGDPAPTASEEDEFELDLIDSMMTPISDPNSAASVVPLVVRGPSDLGEKIKHIKFERAYDDTLVARADAVMQRILTGIDLPKDVVAGLANVKYSNAVVIEASLLRSHIEPLALLIVDALTRAYLRPYLTGSAFTAEQAERVTLWFDPVDIVARPSRADEANDGFDRYALSYSAWRRAHGFDETAAPGANEVVQRMMINKGSFTPELTETLLKVIAPLMMEDARQTAAEQSDNPLPPEVQQALGLPPSSTGSPTSAPAPGEVPPPPGTATPPAPTSTPAAGPPPPPPPPANAGATPNV